MSNNKEKEVLIPENDHKFTSEYFTGRPRKYTEDQVREIISKYFNETLRKDWRITGLAIALNVDRQTIYNWINEKREFFGILKRAISLIEDKYNENCEKRGNAGDIFILKNMGWTDKQEVDLNHSGKVELGDVFGDVNKSC